MGSRFLTALCLLTAPMATAPTASAQVRASERGRTSQTVDGTTITVDYGRPGIRGREIFGEVVHWGEIWTPGANWGTTLEVNRDIQLNGHDVSAGKYSVWVEPQPEEWTIHLHENAKLYHTQHPEHDDFMLSFTVTPEEGPHFEKLTFYFPDFRRDGTTLRLHWGTTYVPLEIQVESTLRITRLTQEEMDPYLGRYTLKMYGAPDAPPGEFNVQFVAADGAIKGAVGPDAENFLMQLLPRENPHEFLLAFLAPDGEVGDVGAEDEGGVLTFSVAQGKAVGFTVTGLADRTWIEATRNN